MPTAYRLSPTHSRFTVQAFATGMLSFFAHSPTFGVGDFDGSIVFADETIQSMELEITVRSEALKLLDKVRNADRQEIENRMRGEVLETAANPMIVYRANVTSSDRLAAGRYQVHLEGTLTLHGTSNPLAADAELLLFDDGIRLRGECWLRLTDFRIKPVTALGGAIQLKNELKVTYDLGALPEGA
jgi:polyisoprenoid-binding protein YceI